MPARGQDLGQRTILLQARKTVGQGPRTPQAASDVHEHVSRTNRGLVLYSRMGARLCDWSASNDGEHGELQVRCEPVYGRDTSKVRGWRVSSGGSLDDWLKALAAELDEPR